MRKGAQNLQRGLFRRLMGWRFRLVCRGEQHLLPREKGLLAVCNHRAEVDLLILATFLTPGCWFIVCQARFPSPLVRRLFSWIHLVSWESMVEQGWTPLADHLGRGGMAALFPEKIPSRDDGLSPMDPLPLQAARLGKADVVALHLEGTQYHASTWREHRLARHWFPKVELSILPPEPPEISFPDLLGRARVHHFIGRETVWRALCRIARGIGSGCEVVTDSTGIRWSYRQLFLRSFVLGSVLASHTRPGERVGLLLPTSAVGLATLLALLGHGRVAALLNFTSGASALLSACRTARVGRVMTSRTFVKKAGMAALVGEMGREVHIFYLEDVRAEIGWKNKMAGLWAGLWPERQTAVRQGKAEDEAVVLFTSGSEGEPKGVALSHDNLLGNIHQIRARIGVRCDDRLLNVLPIFHAFGLTVGSLLPLLTGARCHLHPSPLDYKKIPSLAHEMGATILAGTNTFLAGYARTAHSADFQCLRLVVAGAEPLREETRRQWMERFGVRIFEGYGTTETSPVLSVNTVSAYCSGTVGRLLPAIDYQVIPVSGVSVGGRLMVRGVNVMLGYLQPGGCGVPERPMTPLGSQWYDTGDVVVIDEAGFVRIVGRVKRFAKIGGEMVSLSAVEACAAAVWPEAHHAVVALPDGHKGEILCLVTEGEAMKRHTLLDYINRSNMSRLHLPTKMLAIPEMPIKGVGKIDYPTLTAWVMSHKGGGMPPGSDLSEDTVV